MHEPLFNIGIIKQIKQPLFTGVICLVVFSATNIIKDPGKATIYKIILEILIVF